MALGFSIFFVTQSMSELEKLRRKISHSPESYRVDKSLLLPLSRKEPAKDIPAFPEEYALPLASIEELVVSADDIDVECSRLVDEVERADTSISLRLQAKYEQLADALLVLDTMRSESIPSAMKSLRATKAKLPSQDLHEMALWRRKSRLSSVLEICELLRELLRFVESGISRELLAQGSYTQALEIAHALESKCCILDRLPCAKIHLECLRIEREYILKASLRVVRKQWLPAYFCNKHDTRAADCIVVLLRLECVSPEKLASVLIRSVEQTSQIEQLHRFALEHLPRDAWPRALSRAILQKLPDERDVHVLARLLACVEPFALELVHCRSTLVAQISELISDQCREACACLAQDERSALERVSRLTRDEELMRFFRVLLQHKAQEMMRALYAHALSSTRGSFSHIAQAHATVRECHADATEMYFRGLEMPPCAQTLELLERALGNAWLERSIDFMQSNRYLALALPCAIAKECWGVLLERCPREVAERIRDVAFLPRFALYLLQSHVLTRKPSEETRALAECIARDMAIDAKSDVFWRVCVFLLEQKTQTIKQIGASRMPQQSSTRRNELKKYF